MLIFLLYFEFIFSTSIYLYVVLISRGNCAFKNTILIGGCVSTTKSEMINIDTLKALLDKMNFHSRAVLAYSAGNHVPTCQ